MKRLATILLLLSLTALPSLAQTPRPQPTPQPTPAITRSDEPAPATPPAQAEGTPEAPVIPTSVIIDYLESQPDLMVDIAEVAIAGVGAAYERSQWTGIVAFAGLAVVTCAGFYALYRSTPPDRRPVIARQIGRAGSTFLGGIDEIDLVPGTDLDNVIVRAGKKRIDDKIAELDREIEAIEAKVEAKVQSLYEAEKERKRANEAAQQANRALNGEPQNVTQMPPMGPAN